MVCELGVEMGDGEKVERESFALDTGFWEVVRDEEGVFEFRSGMQARQLAGFAVGLMWVLAGTMAALYVESVTRQKVVECRMEAGGVCEVRDTSWYGTNRRSVRIGDVKFVESSNEGGTGKVHLMTETESYTFPVWGDKEQREERIQKLRGVAERGVERDFAYSGGAVGMSSWGEVGVGVGLILFFVLLGSAFLFRMRWTRCRLSREDGTIWIRQSNPFVGGEIERSLSDIEAVDVEVNIDPDRLTSILGRSGSVGRRIDALLSQVFQNTDPRNQKGRLLVSFADGMTVALNYTFDAGFADTERIVERMSDFGDWLQEETDGREEKGVVKEWE